MHEPLRSLGYCLTEFAIKPPHVRQRKSWSRAGRSILTLHHTCGVANSGEGAREAAMASELTSEAAGLQMAASNPAEGGSDTVETNHSTSDEGATLGKSLSSSSLSTLSAKASAFVPQSVLRTYTR